eukprot:GHRR01007896.1.p1 GENE.GHRR01007896.1~~GHRR01007896.1.p1  ORF type:complete len:555 (+),score=166.79 GHRR01007896.1:1913-3577(+)
MVEAAQITILLVVVAGGCAHAATTHGAAHSMGSFGAAPVPPNFPSSFHATYRFSLPYVYAVQTQGLSFPVEMWYDADSLRLRIDVYGGLDSTVRIKDTTYLVYPRINRTVCDIINDDVGPTLGEAMLGAAPLPDISKWSYGGKTTINDNDVHIWQWFNKQWGKTSTYTFYTTPEGTPVRLYMMGYNVMAGSHFDEYLVDFTGFEIGPFNEDVFAVPQSCIEKEHMDTKTAAANSVDKAAAAGAMAGVALMPWAHIAGIGANALQQQVQLSAAGLQQLRRLAVRASNQQYVNTWNAGSAADENYKLGLNRFADWLPEEYSSLMTAKRSSARSEQVKKLSLGALEAPAGLTKKHLPKHVDWRGTGADNAVKDQATCGSCWAFSATGTMQGAWYVATGQTLSLSEQQLVDCSWEYGNNGCQGGEMEPAIQYIADAGGAASEEDYQYMGQNMFCNKNATNKDFEPAAYFKGFGNVKKRDELSLMYAVWKHGPVAISIDASLLSFKFYTEGVYKDKHCKTGKDYMDHAVLLMGYGTDKLSGDDYWLVKNSWSKYWGEDG